MTRLAKLLAVVAWGPTALEPVEPVDLVEQLRLDPEGRQHLRERQAEDVAHQMDRDDG